MVVSQVEAWTRDIYMLEIGTWEYDDGKRVWQLQEW